MTTNDLSAVLQDVANRYDAMEADVKARTATLPEPRSTLVDSTVATLPPAGRTSGALGVAET